jgi:hypothetical protein
LIQATANGAQSGHARQPFKSKQARADADLCDIYPGLPRLPAMPVAMMVVMVMMTVVPAMPTMMAVMVMMPPMHLRCRQPGILLNRCGGAGIAERQRIGPLGRRRERKQGANGGETKNFRELHECSPWVGCHVCAESHRRNTARNLALFT